MRRTEDDAGKLDANGIVLRQEKASQLKRRHIVDLKTETGSRIEFSRVALCCLLWMPAVCVAHSATLTQADAPAIADSSSTSSADLPSAPEPRRQPSQAQGSQQATGTGQNQPAQQQTNPQQQQKPDNAPSLGDLGFTPQQTQANAQLQALLNKRTQMLKIHQRLGVITLFPMAATMITGPFAKAKGKQGQTITEPSQANLDFHAALGGLTAAMYFTSASYAIFAPKVPGTKRRGATRWHEALAFIHVPGMIATPILGAMAYKQEQAGEKVHGIAAAHGPVAWATISAYGAAIVAVSWPIKFKR